MKSNERWCTAKGEDVNMNIQYSTLNVELLETSMLSVECFLRNGPLPDVLHCLLLSLRLLLLLLLQPGINRSGPLIPIGPVIVLNEKL